MSLYNDRYYRESKEREQRERNQREQREREERARCERERHERYQREQQEKEKVRRQKQDELFRDNLRRNHFALCDSASLNGRIPPARTSMMLPKPKRVPMSCSANQSLVLPSSTVKAAPFSKPAEPSSTYYPTKNDIVDFSNPKEGDKLPGGDFIFDGGAWTHVSFLSRHENNLAIDIRDPGNSDSSFGGYHNIPGHVMLGAVEGAAMGVLKSGPAGLVPGAIVGGIESAITGAAGSIGECLKLSS